MLQIYLFENFVVFTVFYYSLLSLSLLDGLIYISILPVTEKEFDFRCIKSCECCDMFLFDLIIPYLIELRLRKYMGERYD